MTSEKAKKWLKFLGGFLGWFMVNTLLYTLLNRDHSDWYGVLFDYDAILWAMILLGNLIALIVLAILKKTRWIALGITSAMVSSFAINMFLMQLQGAYCFVPVTYIAPAKNRYPVGYLNGNKGKVTQEHCVAYGWAIDPDDKSAKINVEIYSDWKVIATTVANVYRADLKIFQLCPDGTCGFEVDLWPLISANTEHDIWMHVQDAQTGIWTTLSGSHKKIECIE